MYPSATSSSNRGTVLYLWRDHTVFVHSPDYCPMASSHQVRILPTGQTFHSYRTGTPRLPMWALHGYSRWVNLLRRKMKKQINLKKKKKKRGNKQGRRSIYSFRKGPPGLPVGALHGFRGLIFKKEREEQNFFKDQKNLLQKLGNKQGGRSLHSYCKGPPRLSVQGLQGYRGRIF